ncbi:MAG TPA: efflux RND transporter periplasmic adaptor subunit, partial [Gemmatimonadota bacterium]|nr:efflux RND transporter periplasmic adaptor subunit [Gemmatimonadota bacterium]
MSGSKASVGQSRAVLIGVGVVVVLLLAGTWWRHSEGREENEEGSVTAAEGDAVARAGEGGSPTGLAIPVTVDTVRLGTLVLQVEGSGQTEASNRATIAARVAGRIAAVPVGESRRVGRGVPLVRLDGREVALALRQAEAELAQAQARYNEMTLFDERIEDPAVREERAQAARAKSGLATAEIAVSRARLDLANTTIRAPFAGRVANVLVTVGETVTAGQELMTLVDIDPIHVEVQVVEGELRWLAEGNGAGVWLAAFPDTLFAGRIASINPVVDPETRTARVTVVLPNPQGSILPGMFASVTLDGRAFKDRVMIPEEALVERDSRTLVFMFEPLEDGPPGEGLAKWVYVTPGLSSGEVVELVEAEGTEVPAPGTLVITEGNYTLINDAQVRV